MREMKEGLVQFVFGRRVLLMNKATSYGWNGLVIDFSSVQSQTVSAKQQNRIYTVKMEKVVAIMKLRNSGSTLRIWHLYFAVRKSVWAPTIAAWSAAVLPGEYLTQINDKA